MKKQLKAWAMTIHSDGHGFIIIATAMVILFTKNEEAAKTNQLVFVSETVRHGARAPESSDPSGNHWGFKVTDGMLTP